MIRIHWLKLCRSLRWTSFNRFWFQLQHRPYCWWTFTAIWREKRCAAIWVAVGTTIRTVSSRVFQFLRYHCVTRSNLCSAGNHACISGAKFPSRSSHGHRGRAAHSTWNVEEEFDFGRLVSQSSANSGAANVTRLRRSTRISNQNAWHFWCNVYTVHWAHLCAVLFGKSDTWIEYNGLLGRTAARESSNGIRSADVDAVFGFTRRRNDRRH